MSRSDEVRKAVEILGNINSTSILSHGDACCRVAKRFFMQLGMLSLFDDPPALSQLTWLTRIFKWGPVRHPVYWCQLPSLKEVDCGVFAAILRELCSSRNIAAFPFQMIVKYPVHRVQHWHRIWMRRLGRADWIWLEKGYVYHEAVAFVRGGELRAYDPVLKSWVEASTKDGGVVVAIRIINNNKESYEFPGAVWNGLKVKFNEWLIL